MPPRHHAEQAQTILFNDMPPGLFCNSAACSSRCACAPHLIARGQVVPMHAQAKEERFRFRGSGSAGMNSAWSSGLVRNLLRSAGQGLALVSDRNMAVRSGSADNLPLRGIAALVAPGGQKNPFHMRHVQGKAVRDPGSQLQENASACRRGSVVSAHDGTRQRQDQFKQSRTWPARRRRSGLCACEVIGGVSMGPPVRSGAAMRLGTEAFQGSTCCTFPPLSPTVRKYRTLPSTLPLQKRKKRRAQLVQPCSATRRALRPGQNLLKWRDRVPLAAAGARLIRAWANQPGFSTWLSGAATWNLNL